MFIRKYITKKQDLVFYLLALLIVISLLLLHGLTPGSTFSVSGRFMILGLIDCGSQSISSFLNLRCSLVGLPAEGLMPTGSPIYILGALLVKFIGLTPEIALFLISILIMFASLVGTQRLISRLGVNRFIALIMAFVYLGSTGVIAMQGFGGTYWGTLLMPTAIYMVTVFLDRIYSSDLKTKALILIMWSIMSTLQLFIDGYTFFMTATASAIIIFFYSWKKWRNINTYISSGIFLIATATAYILYKKSFPSSDSWGSSSIELFRSMSLDLSTIFRPSAELWWAENVSFRVNPSRLWGDGSNSAYNYVGFTIIVLAMIGIFSIIKTRREKNHKKINLLATSLIFISFVSFVLSLGPSLKWNSEREPVKPPVSYKSYLMPSEAALTSLHTARLYDKVPGLSSMRAIYRWHLLTDLVLIILASVGIQYVVRKKGYKLGAVVVTVVVIELSQNPFDSIRNNYARGDQIRLFNSQVIEPMGAYFNKNDIVVFYPNAVGGNDYLANYIAPKLEIKTFNVGNDKSLKRAQSSRPDDVRKLLKLNDSSRSTDDLFLAIKILNEKTASAVIVPYFDLRWDSYNWPPKSDAAANRASQFLESIEGDESLSVKKEKFFAVVRKKENK